MVAAPSLDGARSASLTLDWLDKHGHEPAVRSSVVVINAIRERGLVDVDKLQAHFARRCRAVVRIPFDRHLETGAEIVLDELAPATRRAYVRLAAAVADGFHSHRQRRPDLADCYHPRYADLRVRLHRVRRPHRGGAVDRRCALDHLRGLRGRLRKVFSPVGIVFKGSGFYRTDSRGKPAKADGDKAKKPAEGPRRRPPRPTAASPTPSPPRPRPPKSA